MILLDSCDVRLKTVLAASAIPHPVAPPIYAIVLDAEPSSVPLFGFFVALFRLDKAGIVVAGDCST